MNEDNFILIGKITASNRNYFIGKFLKISKLNKDRLDLILHKDEEIIDILLFDSSFNEPVSNSNYSIRRERFEISVNGSALFPLLYEPNKPILVLQEDKF